MTKYQMLLGASASIMLLAATSAGAQTAGGGAAKAAQDKADASTVEVLVVTAERREQNLQDAPAAVNVVSGASIEKLHIDDVGDLTNLIPGIKIDGNQRDQLRLGLRGAFASATSPGSGQAVGLYIDGVSYAHTSNVGAGLFDIKQVEVLRGPQGTLYGQNVVGGLINIITRDPGDQLSVDVKGSYSSFNRFDLGAYVAGPLSSTLSGSISFNTSHSDGWERNLVTGNMLDALRTFDARGKLVWKPTDKLTVKLIQDISTDDTYGLVRNVVFGSPARFTVPTDWRQTLRPTDGRYDSYAADTALLVDYDLGWATVSSISSYQHNRPHVIASPQITDPVAIEDDDRRNNNDTFSQELRLAGQAEKLHWQVGAFYLHDNVTQYQQYNLSFAPGTAIAALGLPSYQVNENFKVAARSTSVFAEASYDITSIFGVTVGGRQNWDSKDSNFHDFGQVSAALGALSQAPFVVIQSASWSEFSPKVTLNAKFSDVGPLDKLLFYVTASKGYEAGDFTSGPTVASATGAIPPEIAKNYEAGFKSTFWNHKATLDFTVFHVDYTNLQTLSLNAAGVTQVASTNAIARGAEVGATVNPLPGLYLTADYDYLDTQIAAGAKAPDGTAVGGGKLPQSPPWSYNFQASYIHEIADNNRLRFTVAYTDKGPVYFDVKNTRTAQPQVLDLTKVKDLNAEIALLHGPWTLSVWGKNLTNREMIERVNNGSNSFDLSSAESKAGKVVIDGTILDPRSVGVTLRWTY